MKKLLLIAFVLVQLVGKAEYDSAYVLSITQKYAIPENVSNGDYVGIWKKTYTWSPVGTISFTIEQNYNSAFSIDYSTGLITVSNASQINGQVSQQDMLINLIIRTSDTNGGSEVFELDTARIWVKENAYCKFIDYGYDNTGTGTRTAPYNDFSDVTVAAGYGYFIKRGNTPTDEIYSIPGFQATAAHPTIIGAWGSGLNPEFNGSGLSSANGLFYFLNTSSPSTYCKIYNIDVKNYPGSAFRIATGSNRFGIYNCNFTTNVIVSYTGGLADVYFYGSLDNILINYGHELINLESTGSMAPILKSDASGIYAYNIKSATAYQHNFRYAKSRYSKLSHFYFIGGTRSLQVRYPDIVITDGIITNAYNAADNIGAGIFLVTDSAGQPNDLTIRNVLFQNNQYAMYVYNSNINRTLIEDCRFESSTYNGIYYRYGGEASTIQRSAFINNGSHGILFRTGSQSSNLNINYCLFYGNTGNQIDASAASCATGLKLYNNTVDGNIDLTGASTEIVRNNFFKSLTSAATASNNLDIDNIATGEYFTNYAGHDYSLKSTADLAIDDGLDLDLSPDIQGTTVGNSPDIGAYEYVPSATVSISATDASASEEGQGTGTFTVTRTNTSGNLTVNYSKTGTTSSGDYTQTLTGSVTISSGNTTATITITPVDDASAEGNETVILTLTTGTGYTVGSPSAATVTIADNDEEATLIQTFNVNMAYTGYLAGTGWNDFLTYTAGSSLTNLKNSANTAITGRTIYNEDAWTASANSGMTEGPYIYNVNKSNWVITSGTTRDIEFRGLNNSYAYELDFYGSRITTGETRKIRVTIGTAYDICDNNDNTTDKAYFTNIVPSSGTIRASITVEQGAYGYLNAIILREYSGLKSAQIQTSVISPKQLSPVIYPNPFHDVLRINKMEHVTRVELVNMIGETLFVKQNPKTPELTIDTKCLKSGVYIIRLFDSTGAASTYKVVK